MEYAEELARAARLQAIRDTIDVAVRERWTVDKVLRAFEGMEAGQWDRPDVAAFVSASFANVFRASPAGMAAMGAARSLAISWAMLPERLRRRESDARFLSWARLAPRSSPIWATAETPPELVLRWSRPRFWALFARFSEVTISPSAPRWDAPPGDPLADIRAALGSK